MIRGKEMGFSMLRSRLTRGATVYAMTADHRKAHVKVVFISTLIVEIGLIVVRAQSSWYSVKYTVGCLMTYQPSTAVWIGSVSTQLPDILLD